MIRIEKVWSDRFPDIVANYLPSGAGNRGNRQGYILAGVREDGKGYAKALVRITPDTPAAREQLLVRLARWGPPEPEVPVGGGEFTGRIAPISESADAHEVAMWAEPPESLDEEYSVVAGFDTNGDGELQPSEITAGSVFHFKFVNADAYQAAASSLSGKEGVGTLLALNRELNDLIAGISGLDFYRDLGLNHSPDFLNAFLSPGFVPPGAKSENATLRASDASCRDAVMCLDHNVGASFDAAGLATVPRFVFAADSELAHNIRRSAKWLELLNAELRAAQSEIQDWLSSPPDDSVGSDDELSFQPRRVKRQLDFKPESLKGNGTSAFSLLTAMFQDGNGLDLWLAFGKVNVDVEIVGIASRGGQLSSVKISGIIEDLYDWDFVIDPQPAMIQAGFGPAGQSGRVFFSHVHLDCEYHDLDYYYSSTDELRRESGCSVSVPIEHADEEQARVTLPVIGADVAPGADLKSLIDEMLQDGVEAIPVSLGARSSRQIAGSAVLAYATDDVVTNEGPPSSTTRTQTLWAGAKRWRPVLYVTIDPDSITEGQSATLVLGGLLEGVAVGEGTATTPPLEDDVPLGIRGDLVLGTNANNVITYGDATVHEVQIFAVALGEGEKATSGDDLFDQGVLVGSFSTDAWRVPLRIALDVEVLRSITQASDGRVAFVVRGWEDIGSLVKETAVSEQVFEWKDGSDTTRRVERILGRSRFVSFPRLTSDFLILEWSGPEVTGGGLPAPDLLFGVEEEGDAIDVPFGGPPT